MPEAKDKREDDRTQGEAIFHLTWLSRLSLGEPSLHRRPQVRGREETPRSLCFCSPSSAGLRDPFTLSEHVIRFRKSALSAERGSEVALELGVLASGAFSQAALQSCGSVQHSATRQPFPCSDKGRVWVLRPPRGGSRWAFSCWKEGGWGAQGVQALRSNG